MKTILNLKTLEQIKQQVYTESPYNLGTDKDSAFGTGVNYTLENQYIVKAINNYETLIEALKSALLLIPETDDMDTNISIQLIQQALKQTEE